MKVLLFPSHLTTRTIAAFKRVSVQSEAVFRPYNDLVPAVPPDPVLADPPCVAQDPPLAEPLITEDLSC